MKKLSLNLESLSVESFGTAAAVKATGTVVAHALAISFPNPQYTCAYHCTYQGPTCANQC